jgi:hypothetical protein
VTVGFAGVSSPETPGLDYEPVPGLVYRGQGRLRVSSNAEMAWQTGNLPTLVQQHTLGVANATCGVLGAAAGGGSIGSGFIGLASATMVCEADETVFVQTSYDLEVGAEPPGPEPEPSEPEGDFLMGHESSSPRVGPTPDLIVNSPQGVCEPSTPIIRVGHIFAAVNATQGFTAANSGFGIVVNPINATLGVVGLEATVRKRIVVAAPIFGSNSSTTDGRRLFITAGANATMGHVATATGVSDNFVNSVPATQGHTATPGDATILHRTFPEASEDGMIVTAPTMTQNVVDQETGVTAASIFGTGISTTSEGAIPIGSTGTHPNTTAVAIRFKGKRTSTLTSARVSLRGSGGNSLGQPLLEARILRDDNTSLHKPVDSQRTAVTTNGNQVTYTGTSAHVGSVSDLVSADTTLGRFTFVWSSGAPSLVRNVLYHLELRNVHSDPDANYTSLDTLFMDPVQSPAQPIALDTDMEVLQRNTSGVWSAQSQHSPIFSLGYADGRGQGQAYLWSPQSSESGISGTSQKVRQRFVANRDLRVHKIAARAARWSGTQPLQIRLIRESNGAVLASAAGDSGYFPLMDQAGTDRRTSHRWYAHSFASSFSVTAGVTASLELVTTAAAEYRATFLRESGEFPASAAFYQGVGQVLTDGVTWIDASGQASVPRNGVVQAGDMMFYLGLGSAAQRPRCSADSFTTGFTVGQTTVVSARQLILNDTNPSGTHSATTNFPTGVNPLVINHANSATNCALVVSTANQTISISAKNSVCSFTYVARDIYGQRSSARVTINAVDPGEPSSNEDGPDWYGNPWWAVALADAKITTGHSWQRFRAYKTGTITGVRCFLTLWSDSGYSAGSGGIARVRIFNNNSSTSRPGSAIGGSGTYDINLPDGGFRSEHGHLFTLSAGASVTKGQVYYIYFDNIDPNNSSNWYGVDCLNVGGTPGAANLTNFNPYTDHTGDDVFGQNGTPSPDDRTPLVGCVLYSDGFAQGCGYINAWDPPTPEVVDSTNRFNARVTGTQFLRQSFVPYRTMTAHNLGVCMDLISGSANLVCQIQQSDGTVIQTVSYSTTDFNNAASMDPRPFKWVIKNLSSNITFTQGVTYRLRFHTTSGTIWRLTANQDGANAFSYPRQGSVTVNGFAQYSSNSGSTWNGWVAHDVTGRTDADLCFAFGLVQ